MKSTLTAILLLLTILTSFAQDFQISTLDPQGMSLNFPTAMKPGPDGRIYFTEVEGLIKSFQPLRSAPNKYVAQDPHTITLVQKTVNWNDDGQISTEVTKRQITGLWVSGTFEKPVLYISSSDPRHGGPGVFGDKNLDTNSGVLHRLTWIHEEAPSEVDYSQVSEEDLWEEVDLVRGLPRSEENHAINGLAEVNVKGTNYLLMAVGGNTNAGGPGQKFALATEFALSAAIISFDMDVLNSMPVHTDPRTGEKYVYDLPTVDDPEKPNITNADPGFPYASDHPYYDETIDMSDPFGGNDGLNQAKLVPGGPVQIFAPGFRNPYDLIVTEDRRVLVTDNGANNGWGGFPAGEGTTESTNAYVEGEPGGSIQSPALNGDYVNNQDHLEIVTGFGTTTIDDYEWGSYYGGHPNPIRANPAGAGIYTDNGPIECFKYGNGNNKPGLYPKYDSCVNVSVWRNSKTGEYPLPQDWPPVPVEMANPIEGDWFMPGRDDDAITLWPKNANALAEYTASNHGGKYKGDIFGGSSWAGGRLFRVELNEDATKKNLDDNWVNLTSSDQGGNYILGIFVYPDDTPLQGTIWATTYNDGIKILEPTDFAGGTPIVCDATYSADLDEDFDGFKNADEIDNGNDPCNGLNFPSDNDQDKISDLNDPDDDNDGIADHLDPFQVSDVTNTIPFEFDLFNNKDGFYNLGFTGLMTNNKVDQNYLDWLDVPDVDNPSEDDIYGGATGTITVQMEPGTADGASNDQQKGLQMAIFSEASSTEYELVSSMTKPFPVISEGQSYGIFMGTGDQDNFIKLVKTPQGVVAYQENAGILEQVGAPLLLNPEIALDMQFVINPANGTVKAMASSDGNDFQEVAEIQSTGKILEAIQNSNVDVAFGLIGTAGSGTPFYANWDFFKAGIANVGENGIWLEASNQEGYEPTPRHEHGFTQAGDNFYMIGGRGNRFIESWNFQTKSWKQQEVQTFNLHHFQPVELDGLIYIVSAFTGGFPNETPIQNVKVYDPVADLLYDKSEIPEGFKRGSAGAVAYKGSIYVVSGITNGHLSGHVDWVSKYDPIADEWTALSPIPNARDHIQVSEHEGKIYVAGGRRSNYSAGDISEYVTAIDVYDIETDVWTTLSNTTIPRAGIMSNILDDKLIVFGGEHPSLSSTDPAIATVEAFDINTFVKTTLSPMSVPKHASGSVVNNDAIWTAGGSLKKGGIPKDESAQMLAFNFTGQMSAVGEPIDGYDLEIPNSLVFEELGTKSIVITNIGDQAAIIESASISGSNSFVLNQDYGPIYVSPEGSSQILVDYSGSAGVQQAELTLTLFNGQNYKVVITNDENASGGDDIDNQNPVVLYGMVKEPYTDKLGRVWLDDSPVFIGQGSLVSRTSFDDPSVADPDLYNTKRVTGGGTWEIPVDNGSYDVKLLFFEYFMQNLGTRLMDVNIEDQYQLIGYDILEKGFGKAIDEVARNIMVTDGGLTITLSKNADATQNPLISGIGVFESVDPPIEFETVSNQTSSIGQIPDLTIVAFGGKTGQLTYSAQGLPDGLSIEPTTGYIQGQISDEAQLGIYNVTINATDGEKSAQLAFNWTVTQMPLELEVLEHNQVIVKSGDVVEEELLIQGGVKPYTITVEGLPLGLTYENGIISGTISDDAEAKAYQASIKVTDAVGTEAEGSFNFIVEPTAEPLVIQPISDQTFSSGQEANIQVIATGAGDEYTYTASGLPGGLQIDNSGLISGTINDVEGMTEFDVEVIVDAFGAAQETVTFKIFVQSNLEFTFDVNVVKQPDCQELGELEALVEVDPDYPFEVIWHDDQDNVIESTGLIAGTYKATLTIDVPTEIGMDVTQSKTIELKKIQDVDAPVFVELPDEEITVTTSTIPTPFEMEAEDSCDPDVNIEFSEEFDEDSETITRTWVAMDGAGNTTVFTQLIKIDNITAIQDVVEKLVEIYPNPTYDGRVRLRLENVIDVTIEWQLYDSSGNFVESGNLEKLDQIDFSDKPSGMYLIRLKVDDEYYERKLLIKK